MWNLSKLLSAVWGILGLTVLVTLFLIYANYPDYSSLDFLGSVKGMTLDRHRFFFWFVGLFLVINLSFYAATGVINQIGNSTRLLSNAQHLRTLVALKVLVIGANLFLLTLMIFLRSALVAQDLPGSWQWLVMLMGPLTMVSGLVYLLYAMLFPVK